MVLHNLRFEYNGKSAQIDHMIINRFSEIYILETKDFLNGIKIEENGKFLAYYYNKYKAISSPIKQNIRHIFF